MEFALQVIAETEGHKDLANDKTLAKRLAIIVAYQNQPYLDLDHSSSVVEALKHCLIRGFDLKVDLA